MEKFDPIQNQHQHLEREGTRALIEGDGGEEGHESGAAEELGDEDGGVALGFRSVDPLQRRPQDAVLTAPLSKNSTSIATHHDRS